MQLKIDGLTADLLKIRQPAGGVCTTGYNCAQTTNQECLNGICATCTIPAFTPASVALLTPAQIAALSASEGSARLVTDWAIAYAAKT